VEVLDLRHFASADLRPLLDDEAEKWAALLEWDYRSSSDMILRYLDAKILPGYAAIERGTVFGYCFFVYEGAKGVIGDLYVDGDPGRVRAVEDQLLEHVVDTLQQSPGVHRVEAQLLLHTAGAASRIFDESGFQRYRRLFMKMPLQRQRAGFRAAPSDVTIRAWQERDYQSAAALITNAYRNHVDSDINDQYRTVPGSLRFLNNIVRFPGCGQFDPMASFVAVHRPSQTNIGMILCSRVKDNVGHVTQVCLLPDYRSRGIGEALISATHASLLRRNFSMMSLTVTEENSGAVRLYNHLGFETTHVFDAFVWEG
jgi:ribosomal protein S18 acetylase RimI-like enzyme